MFLKWTGGLLILFAGSGMGVWLAWGYKKAVEHFREPEKDDLLPERGDRLQSCTFRGSL